MHQAQAVTPTTELAVWQQQLADLHASSSWRITAPLRFLGRFAKRLLRPPAAAARPSPPVLKDYAEWVRHFDSPNGEVSANLLTQCDGFAQLPLFSVLLPVHNAALADVRRAIASVQQQIYPNWELCIALGVQDQGESEAIHALLEGYAGEPRIKISTSSAGDLVQLSNQALAMVSAQSNWVMRLNATYLIANYAIIMSGKVINRHKNSQIIYADEDVVDTHGERSEPNFKPDWNLDLHLSRNLVGSCGMYRTALVQKVGGYHAGTAEVIDFDLSLRCLEHVAPEQIVHLPHVLFHGKPNASARDVAIDVASDAGVQALNAHFARQHIAATAENIGHGYRIHHALPTDLPLVSLIIPTRNGLSLLRQCINSIQQKTTYPRYEIIIVDNGSDDAKTLAYFKNLAATPQIRILRIDAAFNYSALNNAAVKVAQGELIALVNNDIEVITPGWLEELVSHALRPGVGAVGARLWFPDDTLQHGGVVLGIHSWAAHAHNHLPRGSLGYQGRMALVSEFSAVTGACLLVRKSSYEAVGGLNEDVLKISCNDVDLCLKLRKIGLHSVWTPFADLYHHESATRGFEDTPAKKARFAGELVYMQRHWGEQLKNDPAYSPNLTLEAQDFGLAWPPRVASLMRPVTTQPGQPPLYERLATLAKGKARVAYFAENVHSSTFRYRAANMAAVLNTDVAIGANNKQTTSAACFFSSDLAYSTEIVDCADLLVISRARYDLDIAQLIHQFKTQDKKVWFDIDDWVFDIQQIDLIISTQGQEPTDEVLNYWYAVISRMMRTMCLCDGVITTNSYLANKISKFIDIPVKTIPNFANVQQLEVSQPIYERKLTQKSNANETIKLGYFSGSASHNRDLALILPALERLMLRDPRVELVLVGPVELEEGLKMRFNDRIKRHDFVDYLKLQELIGSVDFNLVPLQVNDFTHCKSELKFVDAAIVGTLTIASPAFSYAEVIRHSENGYLAEDDQWETVLLQAIAVRDTDVEQHRRMTAAAYKDVQQRFTWQTQRATILEALELS
jgi:O-antigen biosynthesis protein